MKIVTHREKDAADLVFLRYWFAERGEEPPKQLTGKTPFDAAELLKVGLEEIAPHDPREEAGAAFDTGQHAGCRGTDHHRQSDPPDALKLARSYALRPWPWPGPLANPLSTRPGN